MSVLIFLAVLVVLILVHEFGHFITAKKLGMRVDEFGVGFPPKVWGVKKGETEYSVNALPIGGFVRIYGENATGVDEDRERSFVSRPKWAQAVVLVAGVAMNVFLAWVLFIAVFAVGIPTGVSEEEASSAAALTITNVLPESPAAVAGLETGDEVLSISAGDDELSAVTPSAFSSFVVEHAGEELVVRYRSEEGVHESALSAEENVIDGESRPAIGVALALVDTVSLPLHEAVWKASVTTAVMLRDITVGLVVLIADAVSGKADFSQVAGPVGIVGLVGEASAFGFTTLLMFTAFISLNLAIINLLPFPALDGGRLLFVLIEVLKGSPIKPSWVGVMNTVGFALLILLMVAVTYNDIVRMF